jgi:hypothetical protein
VRQIEAVFNAVIWISLAYPTSSSSMEICRRASYNRKAELISRDAETARDPALCFVQAVSKLTDCTETACDMQQFTIRFRNVHNRTQKINFQISIVVASSIWQVQLFFY